MKPIQISLYALSQEEYKQLQITKNELLKLRLCTAVNCGKFSCNDKICPMIKFRKKVNDLARELDYFLAKECVVDESNNN